MRRAVEETRRQGVSLLGVDCYAGDDRKLVQYQESQSFIATQAFTVGEGEPAVVLAR
ncbi:hypothetical protein ACWGQ5_52625 [Streptomyces sp. NPDC055722]